jgi:hypothetical protein
MSDYGSTPPPPPPPPATGGGPVDHPKGMTILILGILSLVCCSPLGIAAWLMGNGALKEIDANPQAYSNRQIVQIGRILGIIGTVILILSVIWIVFLGGLAVLTGGMDTTTY